MQKALLLPPPPPAAPQLTFTFTGRLFDENEVILFLSKNSKQYIAKVGDVLDDSYRVDQIANMNVVLTYLSMNIQQTLTFNSTAIGSLSANELPPNKLMLVPLTANNKNSKNEHVDESNELTKRIHPDIDSVWMCRTAQLLRHS